MITGPIVKWLYIDYHSLERCLCAWVAVDLEAEDKSFKVLKLKTGEEFDGEVLRDYQYMRTMNWNTYIEHIFVGEIDSETGEVKKKEKGVDYVDNL